MIKLLCRLGIHKWYRYTEDRTEINDGIETYDIKCYKKCQSCGKTIVDIEEQRFAHFCYSSRQAGLSTEEMRIILDN